VFQAVKAHVSGEAWALRWLAGLPFEASLKESLTATIAVASISASVIAAENGQ
jgi:hypothetical protein